MWMNPNVRFASFRFVWEGMGREGKGCLVCQRSDDVESARWNLWKNSCANILHVHLHFDVKSPSPARKQGVKCEV